MTINLSKTIYTLIINSGIFSNVDVSARTFWTDPIELKVAKLVVKLSYYHITVTCKANC